MLIVVTSGNTNVILQFGLSSIRERRYVSAGSNPMPSSVMLIITEMAEIKSMVSLNMMVWFMGEADLTTSVCAVGPVEEVEKGGGGGEEGRMSRRREEKEEKGGGGGEGRRRRRRREEEEVEGDEEEEVKEGE